MTDENRYTPNRHQTLNLSADEREIVFRCHSVGEDALALDGAEKESADNVLRKVLRDSSETADTETNR